MTKKLLIIRFSAMGDVAMLVPVIHDLATQYPDTSITLLTRERLTPFFDWMPSNVETLGVNLKDYEGLRGLGRLYARLKPFQFDAVADMHDVLRSKYLRTRFRFAGIPVAVIDKGRREKRELIGQGQTHAPLPAMTNRYAQVLSQLGMPVSLSYKQAFDPSAENLSPVTDLFGRKPEEERWVGVAPFAAHENKVYPLPKMHEVVKTLSGRGMRVFLFGAGKHESEVLAEWEEGNQVVSICGKMKGLHDEMLLMSQLDLMLAMDSSNMHIASIVGTPTVSVWGATHPKAGFTPWGQPQSHIIEDSSLPCRPCSIYGKEPCRFHDLRCMNRITPETIVEKVDEVLQGH